MLLAFALAIAVHEILAGLIPHASPEPERLEIVSHVDLARISRRPLPTPTPPPPPSPHLVSHARTIAPVETHVIARTTTGLSSRKEIVHRVAASRPKPPPVSHSKPVWDLPAGGQGAGAGNASGAGSLGTGGTGTGAGNAGTGSGASAGNEPCGFVTFMNPHGARFDPQTRGFWVDVQMSVHFPDGHSESLLLDYPWYYPSSAANPFENESVPMLFQWPPEDKRAAEPSLVQYVMSHSAAPGITLLKDCP
ncbi:MAG: hypothetical protein JO029_13115 [Candidatus Eremiobacteraeota bacterium]|nr:hypothetical protein [Candidatus Eremiobacteraeota bacterium]